MQVSKKERNQHSVQCYVNFLENHARIFATKYTTRKHLSLRTHKTARDTIRKRKPVLGIPALAQALFSKATKARMLHTHTQISTTHENPVQNTLFWQCEGIRWNRIGWYRLQHSANRRTLFKPWTISCTPWCNARSFFSSDQPRTKA